METAHRGFNELPSKTFHRCHTTLVGAIAFATKMVLLKTDSFFSVESLDLDIVI